VYETQDGKSLAVAPIEPQFYRPLLERRGLTDSEWHSAGYPALDCETITQWSALKDRLAGIFRTRPPDHWCELFSGSDVWVTPVLTLQKKAVDHPHNLRTGR
jgi:alpha-methylacyl-CoA racemase